MSTAQDRYAAGLAGPPSPCIKICVLGAHGYCQGCLRTGEEIGRWLAMTSAEQWRLLAELQQRRKLLPEGSVLKVGLEPEGAEDHAQADPGAQSDA